MRRAKTNLLSIAFKNLGRHKVKSSITIIAIAIGIALYIWMDAWLLGMNLDSKRNLLNYETGSAKIYSKAYFDKKDELPTYESFKNYDPIIKKLDEAGYNAAPHAVFTGSLMSLEQELPFEFVGIDPELENQVFRYNEHLEGEESKFVENGKFNALLGVKGAKDLKVSVEDKVRCSVTIDIKDEKGKVQHVHQLIDLAVGGIVNSPNPKTNGYIAYLPLDILQDEMGLMLEGAVTEICIRKKGIKEHQLPKEDESPEYIIDKLGDTLPEDLILVGWQEDAKDYLAMAAGDIWGTYIMIGILFLLAAIGIANTMLMAIYERTKEIGMLRALGMKDKDVIRLFIFEAAFIGLIGSMVGIAIGIPLDIWVIYEGIDYTEILEEANMTDFGYRIKGVFRGAWNVHTIIGSGIVGTIIAALTAIVPARKAVKMSIVDTLRFE